MNEFSYKGLSSEDWAFSHLIPYCSYIWPHPDYDAKGNPVYETRADGTVNIKGFMPKWFHKYIAQKLEEAEARKIDRILISIPVRHGKTKIVNDFVSWYLGRNPSHSVIHASSSETNAGDMGRVIRNTIDSPTYQAIFPGVVLAKDSASSTKFDVEYPGTEQGKMKGGYLSIGCGTRTQGKKGNLIILDDVIGKTEDAANKSFRDKMWEWYLGDIYTRKEPGAVIIVVQTRYSEDDLIGRLKREHAHENWFEINIPVQNSKKEWLWPERFSKKEYENMKASQSVRNWQAMYMQRPVQEDGEIFSRKMFRTYSADNPLPDLDFIIQSYDTAYGENNDSDFNAGTTWGIFNANKWVKDDEGPKYPYGILLLDAWKHRQTFPELRECIADEYEAVFGGNSRRPDLVIVEAKATGVSIVQELRFAGIPIKAIIPKGDKRSRAFSIQHILEMGYVWFPESKRKRGEFRDWCEPLIKELVSFDRGEYDDFVDSAVQALRYISDSGWLRAKPLVEEEDDPPEYHPATRENPYG